MTEEKKKEKTPIEQHILHDWIKCAAAGIITRQEARGYVESGYIAEWQFEKMFPNVGEQRNNPV